MMTSNSRNYWFRNTSQYSIYNSEVSLQQLKTKYFLKKTPFSRTGIFSLTCLTINFIYDKQIFHLRTRTIFYFQL